MVLERHYGYDGKAGASSGHWDACPGAPSNGVRRPGNINRYIFPWETELRSGAHVSKGISKFSDRAAARKQPPTLFTGILRQAALGHGRHQVRPVRPLPPWTRRACSPPASEDSWRPLPTTSSPFPLYIFHVDALLVASCISPCLSVRLIRVCPCLLFARAPPGLDPTHRGAAMFLTPI
jgi:hypothetical protein